MRVSKDYSTHNLEYYNEFSVCPYCCNKKNVNLTYSRIFEDGKFFVGTRLECSSCNLKIEFQKEASDNFGDIGSIEKQSMNEALESWNGLYLDDMNQLCQLTAPRNLRRIS